MSTNRKNVSKNISGLLLIVLCLLLGLSIAKQWLPKLDIGFTILLYVGIYLVPIFWYCARHRYKPASTLRLKGISPKYWVFTVLFGLSICLLSTLINIGTGALFRTIFHVSFENGIVDFSSTNQLTLVLTSVLLPAFSEELLLRGLVQAEYEKYGVTVGVLLTSFIFALFHTNPSHMISLFVAGVCYGVLTVLFRSIWPAVIAHAINNGVAVYLGANQDFVRYILQDRLFLILGIIACFLLLIFTLKMLETAIGDQLGKSRTLKRSTRSLAYGDPLVSPWIWLFIALCIGKMVYNGFF